MPDLWLPGIPRVTPTNQPPIPLGLQGRGKRLFTWHTFEAGYDLTATRGAQVTNHANSTPTFCFNPVSGELVQQLPANVGCRTLKANGPSQHTNAYGDIHMQVEVIAYARRPWTLDLTAAGAASLVKLMNFLRSWGIPDQWAWSDVLTPAATYAEANARGYRRQPDRSGHAFHSKWWANDHWDPGAIAPPWTIAPAGESKPDPNRGFDLEHLERVESLLDVLGYEGADVWARVRAYQKDHELEQDGLPGPATTTSLEDTMSTLPEQVAAAVWSHNIGKEGAQARSWLRGGNLKAGRAQIAAQEAAVKIAGQDAAIKALTEALGTREGINPEQLQAAVQAAMSNALAGLKADVTLTIAAEEE